MHVVPLAIQLIDLALLVTLVASSNLAMMKSRLVSIIMSMKVVDPYTEWVSAILFSWNCWHIISFEALQSKPYAWR